MNRVVKAFVSCVATLAITVALLCGLTNLMERKSSDYKYSDFFEEDENFDVLFFGTSHVINGIFPMELWNDYGIVSYNFGGHANLIPTTYWVMENALEYTTPNVVVIDCFEVQKDYKTSANFSNVHLSFDAFPLSISKIRAAWDLLDDPVLDEMVLSGELGESDEPRNKMALLWDYSVYHSRWSELDSDDFEPGASLEKGGEARIAVTVNTDTFNKLDKSQKIEGGTVGEEYLRKMIEECQSRGIDVLLTYLPFPPEEGYQLVANYVYDLADEYGVNYIDFLDMDLVDYRTDLYDGNHLNVSGARKVTEYLGQYLIDNYDVSDQRGNTSYAGWYIDYGEYTGLKNDYIIEQNDLVNYLMLLSGDDIDIVISIRNKDVFTNGLILTLMENDGVDVNNVSGETDFIIIKSGGEASTVLDNFTENGCVAETSLGNITMVYTDESLGKYALYIDGEEYASGNMLDDTSMQICVRRKGAVIDDVRFVYSVNPEDTAVVVSEVNR
jgi:hypothetical protein